MILCFKIYRVGSRAYKLIKYGQTKTLLSTIKYKLFSLTIWLYLGSSSFLTWTTVKNTTYLRLSLRQFHKFTTQSCVKVWPFRSLSYDQCDQSGEISPFWQNLQSLGQIFKVLGNFLRVYLLFRKLLDRLWQIYYTIGQVFIVVNGQIMKNKLAIWSHWLRQDLRVLRFCFAQFCLCKLSRSLLKGRRTCY